jgi:hypothetical protein
VGSLSYILIVILAGASVEMEVFQDQISCQYASQLIQDLIEDDPKNKFICLPTSVID